MAWSTQYPTTARMENILTGAGVDKYLLDADGNTDSTALDRAKNFATGIVNLFLLTRYEGKEAELAANELVIDIAVDIANFELCRQRGDMQPESIIRAYQRAMDILKGIRDGLYNLPGVTPTGRKGWVSSIPKYLGDHIDDIYPTSESEVIIVDGQGEE